MRRIPSRFKKHPRLNGIDLLALYKMANKHFSYLEPQLKYHPQRASELVLTRRFPPLKFKNPFDYLLLPTWNQFLSYYPLEQFFIRNSFPVEHGVKCLCKAACFDFPEEKYWDIDHPTSEHSLRCGEKPIIKGKKIVVPRGVLRGYPGHGFYPLFSNFAYFYKIKGDYWVENISEVDSRTSTDQHKHYYLLTDNKWLEMSEKNFNYTWLDYQLQYDVEFTELRNSLDPNELKPFITSSN